MGGDGTLEKSKVHDAVMMQWTNGSSKMDMFSGKRDRLMEYAPVHVKSWHGKHAPGPTRKVQCETCSPGPETAVLWPRAKKE